MLMAFVAGHLDASDNGVIWESYWRGIATIGEQAGWQSWTVVSNGPVFVPVGSPITALSLNPGHHLQLFVTRRTAHGVGAISSTWLETGATGWAQWFDVPAPE
jgi:hypothetical protein